MFKKADHLSAYFEATQLAGFEEPVARKLFGAPPAGLKAPRLIPLPTAEAQAQFLERFHRLAIPALDAKIGPCPVFWLPPCPASMTPSQSHRPSHLVTLLSPPHMIATPEGFDPEPPSSPGRQRCQRSRRPADHPPGREHIDRLIAFARGWDAQAPLLIHCWAGISRSMASAFTVLCDRLGRDREIEIALAMRRRAPHASPNTLLVRHADEALGRGGRMVTALTAMGQPLMVAEGVTTAFPLIDL